MKWTERTYYPRLILVLLFVTGFGACNKEPETTWLPSGLSPYTEEEVASVPYSGTDQLFKLAPDFSTEIKLTFLERIATEEIYAWDQTYFQLASDPYLKVEARLRYLQTGGVNYKTLALYMPYWDNDGVIRSTIFEFPIDRTNFTNTFFESLVIFHDTLDLGPTTWTNVYEIKQLKSTKSEWDSDENFNLVYYTKEQGIIGFNQINGDQWVLFP